MTLAKPNKHELKTKETREKLLRAAEKIFLEEGYAGAELGRVAAMAGRTTGAIYAHFKSKEDIFLALFEESLQRKRKALEKVLASPAPKEKKREQWRNLFLAISRDRVWSLLLLEFKLFAIRHPDAQNHLRARMRQAFGSIPGSPVQTMLEDLQSVGTMPERIFAIRMMQPLLSAVALEATLFSEDFDDETIERYLLRVFDAMI
jgi:AcrR family transcriptional regulator